MRQERDREDLMAEATALVQRAELALPGWTEHITVGFRRDGSTSFYFGPEEVYQFNSRQQLRRAFRDGLLLKAVDGVLAQLRRERTPTAVHLVRRDLTAGETLETQARVREVLSQFLEGCRQQQARLIAQVPPEADVVQRILAIGDELLKVEIAAMPNAL